MENTVEKFKALSNECRLRIMRVLLKANTKLCICEMMDTLEKEQYQISRCLSALKDAQLIYEERDGRLLFYSPNKESSQNRNIFLAIEEAESETLKQDLLRLEERLSKRVNGEITVTYCCN